MTHEHFAAATRIDIIESARGRSLGGIYRAAHSLIEQVDNHG